VSPHGARDTHAPERPVVARLALVTIASRSRRSRPLSVDKSQRPAKNRGLDFARRFGQNLARCRRLAGLSQEELGVRASLHRTAIGQLERGERVARTDTLVKLAGSLSVRPEELLDGLEWVPGRMTLGELSVQEEPAP
jgi:ribosome-binding protein aMBF1 (putative translation factor)